MGQAFADKIKPAQIKKDDNLFLSFKNEDPKRQR